MNNTMAAVTVAATLASLPAGAQAQDAREGPTMIKACGTISKPGSYKLANNLAITGGTHCLLITADAVTIDLAGFSIIGKGAGGGGIHAEPFLRGIAVRNGSISGFGNGVGLEQDTGSIVEGLRVFSSEPPSGSGIIAQGIVKGNTVLGREFGIQATGTVTGNYVENSSADGIVAQAGSTLIGNTVIGNANTGSVTTGLAVTCLSNLTDNTAIGSVKNLVLFGEGCNNTNNVAP